MSTTEQTELAIPPFEIVTDDAGLSLESKNQITLAFQPFAVQAQEWKDKAAAITDPKEARIARLEIKSIRIAAEKKRKELKEDSLNRGRAIDGANKKLLEILEPIEAAMEEKEKAEERRLAAEREKLVKDRCDALRPYWDAVLPMPSNLADLTSEQFGATLADSKLLHETKEKARIEREEADRIAREKAEEERKAKEAEELAERERIKAENERLRKEAEEREAAAEIERKKQEDERRQIEEQARKDREAIEQKAREEKAAADAELAKARKAQEEAERVAREAKEKQEREEKARRDAEEARQKAEAAAAAKAAKAPDKDKVTAYSAALAAVQMGDMKTAEGKALAGQIAEQMGKLASWLAKQAENL